MPDAAAFDTLAAAETMAEAGIEESHAKTIASSIRDGRAGLATRADLDNLEARMDARIAALRADIYRALWIQGAGIVAIMMALKAFG